MVRGAVAAIILWLGALAAPPAAIGATHDVAAYFTLYYQQQISGGAYQGPLDFLRDAAAVHTAARDVLRRRPSRAVTIDAPDGYLQVTDSRDTDQVLTLATYRRGDGRWLVVVAASNCADGCSFAVSFFEPRGDRLVPIARATVVPAIDAGLFIKPGHALPAVITTIVPAIDYVPARRGPTLTLKPWYGYEAEAQISSADRDAIRSIVLSWDRQTGRFVLPR